MKSLALLIAALYIAALPARANPAAYALCGTNDSYILLYKSTQKFDELGKLRCGEQVEVVAQTDDYAQVRTADGRLGWVLRSDLSSAAPLPQETFTFGLTKRPAPQPPLPNVARPEIPVAAHFSESAPLITDVNVMKMQGAHMSPEAIIARMNTSRCDFDTSPAGLHRLKLSGVSDRIVLAMLHAPAAFPMAAPDAATSVEATIAAGTPVQVALRGDVPSDALQEGSVVEMAVVQDVTLNGVTVIARGAEARARIMAVRHPSLGSSGEAIWFMQDLQAVTGDRIPANFAAAQDAKVAMGNFAGYPYFISDFRKNAPAIVAAGDSFTSLVSGNMALRVLQKSNSEEAAATPKVQPALQLAPTVNVSGVFPTVVQAPEQQAAVKP